MVAMLACNRLLFINKAMMTETEFDGPSEAPMAKLLSPMLMIAQWIFGIAVVMFLFMALVMALPSSLRDSLLELTPTEIDPLTLMGRCLVGLVVAVGWFFVLKLLRCVVKAVIHGDPFLPANIARLRNIWIIFAATEVCRMIGIFLMGGPGEAETGSVFGIRLGTWFFIFVIATISEAFRNGAALRAEQELTI